MKILNLSVKHFSFVLFFCCLCCLSSPSRVNAAETIGAKPFLQIIQVNDVYTSLPLDDGLTGGLARIATLKKQKMAVSPLGRQNANVLFVLPGDFLSPSVASTVFKGKQMVEVLNKAGLDMATVGNHEFDFGLDVLLERMKEANWTWLMSNIVDQKTGQVPLGAKPYVVKKFGKVKVGFVGLCLNGDEITPDNLRGSQTAWRILPPAEALEVYLPVLQEQEVEVIVALTHQLYEDDLKLAEAFPELDLIVGGHEHYPINSMLDKTLISKAGSDARFAAEIDFYQNTKQKIYKTYNLLAIGKELELDELTQDTALKCQSQLDARLEEVVGQLNQPLEARSAVTRSRQTDLGSLIAEAMRKEVQADIAILNGGSIRLDKVIQPGPITKKDIISIHPFEDKLCKAEVTGESLLKILNHGVARKDEKLGRYPQVAGLDFELGKMTGGEYVINNLQVNSQPIDLQKKYTVAVSDYILRGGDGYDELKKSKVLIGQDAGMLLVELIERRVFAGTQAFLPSEKTQSKEGKTILRK